MANWFYRFLKPFKKANSLDKTPLNDSIDAAKKNITNSSELPKDVTDNISEQPPDESGASEKTDVGVFASDEENADEPSEPDNILHNDDGFGINPDETTSNNSDDQKSHETDESKEGFFLPFFSKLFKGKNSKQTTPDESLPKAVQSVTSDDNLSQASDTENSVPSGSETEIAAESTLIETGMSGDTAEEAKIATAESLIDETSKSDEQTQTGESEDQQPEQIAADASIDHIDIENDEPITSEPPKKSGLVFVNLFLKIFKRKNPDEIESYTAPQDEEFIKIKKRWSVKKRIVISVISCVLSILLGASAYAYEIISNPMGQFQSIAQQVTPAPTEEPAPQNTTQPELTPIPTLNPYELLLTQADMSLLDSIVNIMLIGVDHSTERDTWNGKHAFHSDVMIVLSVNTETNEVHMISLPRDTYANIPGVDGIYKLNASIDCGGGWPTEEGFEKVCEAASWMLGGIPIQYYYAVDMNAVKGLVDTIGGVDFNIDIAYTIQGRSYEKGFQHLDGQGALDYMRVRKHIGSESGDLNRINRQKNMLVAIFNKLKESGLLANVPDIIDAFDGNLYTNTTFGQTAGLAVYAYDIDAEDIQMHSMVGRYHNIFNWNFVITDQSARVELIKDIYGIDVPKYNDYSYSSAAWRWEKMQANVIEEKASSVLPQVKTLLDADSQLPVYVEPTPTPEVSPATSPTDSSSPTSSDTSSASPSDAASVSSTTTTSAGMSSSSGNLGLGSYTLLSSVYNESPFALLSANSLSQNPVVIDTIPPEGYRQYGSAVWDLYNKAVSECNSLLSIDSTDVLYAANIQLKADIEQLCGIFGIGVPNWRVNYESNSNEIYVDFN